MQTEFANKLLDVVGRERLEKLAKDAMECQTLCDIAALTHHEWRNLELAEELEADAKGFQMLSEALHNILEG